MKKSKDIQGWFNYKSTFMFLADSVPDNGTFIEGGAWLGASSAFLCDYVGDRINIFIVDTWKGSPNEIATAHKLATQKDIYPIFLENMGDRKFTPIRKNSLEAAKDFENESCDVVYIDMDHTYEAVKKDIEAWLPKVKTGGYLAGHDYGFEAVAKAVNEAFPKDKIITMDGPSWIFKKESL